MFGKKVLQLVNDADNNVFNGDIGFIHSIRFMNTPYKKEIITIDFDGNFVTYQKKDLKNIRHAYAITIHKSQGSEFKIVVIPVFMGGQRLMTRNLLYTAVTRAQRMVILVGDKNTVFKMVDNNNHI